MKLYNTNLTLQNLGSSLLVILRGTQNDVNETFNSFYNYMGAGGKDGGGSIEITGDKDNSLGVFWTNEKQLIRYWANQFANRNPKENLKEIFELIHVGANTFIEEKINEMFDSPEKFLTFGDRNLEESSIGTISHKNYEG